MSPDIVSDRSPVRRRKANVSETSVNVRLPFDLLDRIVMSAEKGERSVSAEIRRAMKFYLEMEER